MTRSTLCKLITGHPRSDVIIIDVTYIYYVPEKIFVLICTQTEYIIEQVRTTRAQAITTYVPCGVRPWSAIGLIQKATKHTEAEFVYATTRFLRKFHVCPTSPYWL